ncbi:sigma-54 dependent transcriptional regulator [Fulvivirga kasyanovii]|uniref:Sigma-54-dependent Fis family transcriptional regulator n=1 Tax=Fulvivirga kasyanovii TaxID=396812 RepID=A0ABW9S052_9BACT|nr:sigma-54 dependent transcriptional regulator [Fulvivirga kasyanovii]MTI29089.1 sigma-54-dependent Fis family transcriptional regulator [Fulvivirga kasyanovii]
MSFKIFIVEDDPWYGQMLLHHLSLNPDYTVELYTTAKECLSNLSSNPQVICTDYGLPDMNGESLVSKIKANNQDIPIVVISGQEEIAVAVNLLKSGASEYIIKNDHTTDLLWKAILNIRENLSLKSEINDLKEQLREKHSFEKSIIGQSDALKNTFTHIEKAISSNINVSITGETGTGKEVVAKAIHFNSIRSKKRFVAVNMAAIPRELIESELLGHEKGAFTGAVGQKPGKFEEADGGTIFLDEIAELDLNLQSKLLRVIQERECVRIGGNKSIKFNVRLITATHKNLMEEVKEGNFREDLYYRILGLPIELPPLRNRGKDVLILARHFIKEYARENKISPPILSEGASDKLLKYNFPGNVRELKAVIDLACVMCDNGQITEQNIRYHTVSENGMFTITEKTLREYNADIISFFMDKYNNNVLEVSKKLDIGKSTIYNMIKNGEVPGNKAK